MSMDGRTLGYSGTDPEMRLSVALRNTLGHEGGWVDDPLDLGGVTNQGITLPSLAEYWAYRCINGTPTKDDLRKLTANDVASFYGRLYFDMFMKVEDDKLFYLLCDTAVNNGRGRAVQWLQRAVGAVEDGVLGPKTLARVNNANQETLYYDLFAIRMKAYGVLVTQRHEQAKFVAGWLNRLADFIHWSAL